MDQVTINSNGHKKSKGKGKGKGRGKGKAMKRPAASACKATAMQKPGAAPGTTKQPLPKKSRQLGCARCRGNGQTGQILPTREAWQEYVNAQKRAKWIAICFQPKDFLGCISSFVENINHLWICTKPLLYMHPWSGQHKAWNASGTITCEPHVRRMAKSHKCRVAKQAARYLNDCVVVPLLL